MKKRKYYFWTGVIVSSVFLYISFSNFDFKTIVEVLQEVKSLSLIGGVIVFVLSYFLRAPRWQMMLRGSNSLSFKAAIAGVFIGQFGNNVLPWRLGDLWRAVIARKMDGFSVIAAGTSLLMEKIYDGLSVFLLSIIALLSFSFKKDIRDSIITFGMGVVGFLALLWVFYLFVEARTRRSEKDSIIKKVVEGLSSFKKPGVFLRILFFSVVIWTVESLSFMLFFNSMGINLKLLEIFIIVFILNFAMIIPAAPANVGTFEYAIVISASIFSIKKSMALSAGLVIHFLRFVSISLLGLVLLYMFKMSFKEEVQEVEKEAEKVEI